MKWMILIIVLIQPLIVDAQSVFKNAFYEKRMLIRSANKVKSEKIYSYSLDKKGRITSKSTLFEENHYDKNGNTVRQIIYSKPSKIEEEFTLSESGHQLKFKIGRDWYQQVCEYGEDGEPVRYTYYNDVGELTAILQNERDKALLKTIGYRTNGEKFYEQVSSFDSIQNKITQIDYAANGSPVYETIYFLTVDSLISEYQFTNKLNTLKVIKRLIYDGKQNLTEIQQFTIANVLSLKLVYSHDDKDLISEEFLWQVPNNRLLKYYRYEYEFFD